jgi:hypothetical protein
MEVESFRGAIDISREGRYVVSVPFLLDEIGKMLCGGIAKTVGRHSFSKGVSTRLSRPFRGSVKAYLTHPLQGTRAM